MKVKDLIEILKGKEDFNFLVSCDEELNILFKDEELNILFKDWEVANLSDKKKVKK